MGIMGSIGQRHVRACLEWFRFRLDFHRGGLGGSMAKVHGAGRTVRGFTSITVIAFSTFRHATFLSILWTPAA